MRITNKIMQRNNLSNINTNKIYQDKLSTQMSTQKKINRPSDDPVVAIRALRLRSNVTEVTQYYSKNIPDAESWLDLTEDSLKNLTGILTDMIKQCDKGSNSPLETKGRQIILEQLKGLAEGVYSTGDADYAGRYIFTGFRTDTPLSFDREQTIPYTITEQVDTSALDSVVKVNTDQLLNLNSSNYMDAGMDVKDTDISKTEAYRLRLAYGDCSADGSQVSISFKKENPANPGQYLDVTWGAGGAAADAITTMHPYDNPDPYATAAADDDALIYVPETGELLMGKNRYNDLMSVKDSDATTANEGEIRVTYQKEHWVEGDLRPEHYFACTANPGDPEKEIAYNKSYLTDGTKHQEIEYDVGFNQRIRVNSTADECFKHGIGREVDDIMTAMQNVLDLEGVEASLKSLLKDAEGDEVKTKQLTDQLDAVGKALTYAKNKEQKLFEEGITAFQGYLDDANLCMTNCGNRGSKLELFKNRSQSQKTSFETLKSTNEDIDITEVLIKLNSAELTYNASLLATGKVMQTSLLNFI